MSITRKFLKGMGLTEEQVDSVIEAHADTVDGLKADLARYKGDAEKLPVVQEELNALKAAGDGGWKEKHDTLKKDFEQYKKEQTAKETHSAKEKAYRAILQEVGISEKRLEKVLQLCEVDSVELDENGAIKNADKLKDTIKADWSDFIVTTTTEGAQMANPPMNNGGSTMSKDEIMNIKDTGERQAAIAANHELFGI